MRIDDGYRVFEYGLLLAANEAEKGGLCWVAVGSLRVIDAAVAPIEGMWAKGLVKLASEPKGKRFGLFDAKGRVVDIEAPVERHYAAACRARRQAYRSAGGLAYGRQARRDRSTCALPDDRRYQ